MTPIQKRRHLPLYIAALLCAAPLSVTAVPVHAQQTTMGIAAVVNDAAISMRDVEDRIRLVLASSGLPDNKDIRARIMPQVIESLIEEQLKLQEARRNKLAVSDEEVQEGLATIAKQNNFTSDQFVGIMKKQGIPKNTLTDQIRAQLAWNKVVKEKLRRQVDVSETDLKVRTERLKSKIGQTEFLVSEIFLPAETPKRLAEAQQFAQRLTAEMKEKKIPFGALAAQFSKAAGADKGGSIGWVQQGQLDPALDKILMTLEPGGVSAPVRNGNGVHILYLQKKRTLTEDSIPPRDELMNMIGFERLDRVQQRALMDLKSSAFIDRRV